MQKELRLQNLNLIFSALNARFDRYMKLNVSKIITVKRERQLSSRSIASNVENRSENVCFGKFPD